jgi:hypothetical protein
VVDEVSVGAIVLAACLLESGNAFIQKSVRERKVIGVHSLATSVNIKNSSEKVHDEARVQATICHFL